MFANFRVITSFPALTGMGAKNLNGFWELNRLAIPASISLNLSELAFGI